MAQTARARHQRATQSRRKPNELRQNRWQETSCHFPFVFLCIPITSIKARRKKKKKKRKGYHQGNSTRATRAETKLAVMLFERTWFSERKKVGLPPAEVSELSFGDFSAPSFSSPPCIVSVLGLVVPWSVPPCGLAPVAPGVAEL